VPATKALAWNPDLEKWLFAGVWRFTLVLTATVLGELDRLKVEHRNPDFRAKAEGVINRLKSYRRRGELSRGVVLRRSVSTLKTIALEPKVEETLPWLDPTNDDDRVLASFIEVMRQHPRTPVILVTRDINLQNKVEYAGLPFVEPPDPAASRSRTS
jgi:predicted ribonuclease YlaK